MLKWILIYKGDFEIFCLNNKGFWIIFYSMCLIFDGCIKLREYNLKIDIL